MASNSILKPSQAEQRVSTLLQYGNSAEKAIQRLRDELAKADQETRELLGKERLGRLAVLAGNENAVPNQATPPAVDA